MPNKSSKYVNRFAWNVFNTWHNTGVLFLYNNNMYYCEVAEKWFIFVFIIQPKTQRWIYSHVINRKFIIPPPTNYVLSFVSMQGAIYVSYFHFAAYTQCKRNKKKTKKYPTITLVSPRVTNFTSTELMYTFFNSERRY